MRQLEDLLRPIELAEETQLSVSLIRKLMREGELEYIEFSPKNRRIVYGSWLSYMERKKR